MKHTIRAVPQRLSDGSAVYNVLVQIDGSISATSRHDALELIEKLSKAITDHSNDEVDTLWD